MDAVKAGVIPSDSYLVVENLDRISRDTVIQAQKLFIELLELGLTIVTGQDQKVYTLASVSDNLGDLIISLLLFARAHEESKTKQNRTYGHALALIERHKKGERVNIKSIGSNVWWVDDSGPTIEPHPVYFKVAQEVVELTLKGWGSYLVADYLNERYTPPITTKRTRNPERWSLNLLRKMHTTRALIGEKHLTVKGHDYVLENYYPPLVDEQTFFKIRAIKEENRSTSTSQEYVSLVTGIGVAKCKACNNSLTAFRHRGKLRYVCMGGQQNISDCPPWSFSAHLLDDTTIRFCMDKIWKPQEDKGQLLEQEIKAKKANIADLDERISGLVDLIAKSPRATASSSLLDKVLELEQGKLKRQSELEALLKQTAEEKAPDGSIMGIWQDVSPSVLDLYNSAERLKVRELIKASVSRIEAEKFHYGYKFYFHFKDGAVRSCYRDKNALIIDGSLDGTSIDHLEGRKRGLLEWGTPPEFIEDDRARYLPTGPLWKLSPQRTVAKEELKRLYLERVVMPTEELQRQLALIDSGPDLVEVDEDVAEIIDKMMGR